MQADDIEDALQALVTAFETIVKSLIDVTNGTGALLDLFLAFTTNTGFQNLIFLLLLTLPLLMYLHLR